MYIGRSESIVGHSDNGRADGSPARVMVPVAKSASHDQRAAKSGSNRYGTLITCVCTGPNLAMVQTKTYSVESALFRFPAVGTGAVVHQVVTAVSQNRIDALVVELGPGSPAKEASRSVQPTSLRS
jgi:hypothetical protein